MPHPNPHRCHVKLVGPRCEHDLCFLIKRGVPDELRCPPNQPDGYGRGAGGCCMIPPDLQARVSRELRDNLEECKRQRYVLVSTA